MKKILVTLVAMCASFFAMADFISGTSFENYGNGGVFDPAKDDAGSTTATYWSTNAYDSVLSNYAQGVQLPARPEHFAAGITNTYLYVDTSSATLDRYINPLVSGEGGDTHAVTNINAGLYFDSLVQFTASDTPVEQFSVATGDKLAVWLLATEDDPETTELNEASTNLVVTAGYLGNGNVPTTKSYVISNLVVAAGSWHRLTIKAIGELGMSATAVAGFVVFVDGTAVTSTVAKADATGTVFASLNATAQKWANDNALFPSIVPHDDLSAQTLSSVSFKGTGAIDDLVFTTQAPSFAAEAATFTLTWDAGVTTVQYKIDDGSWTDASIGVAVPNTYGSVLVRATYDSANGYVAGQWQLDGTNFVEAVTESTPIAVTAPTVISIVSKQNLFQVGGAQIASMADLLTAIGDAGGSPVSVKLLRNVSVGAYDVDASAWDTFNVSFGQTVVLDLNGKDLVCTNAGATATVQNLGGTLTITNSVPGAGSIGIVASTEPQTYAVYSLGGTTSITAGQMDGAVASVDNKYVEPVAQDSLTLTGGSYLSDVSAEFYLAAYVNAEAYNMTYASNYWTVSAKGGGQPEVPTYALTIPSVTGATAAVTTNGVAAETYTAIESNAAVVVTWTAQNDYKITAGATESFTMTSAKTAATPTVVAITYATVTITPVDNCTIAVSNGNAEVVSGAKFDVEDKVVLSVTRTAAEGYELTAGYAASENITATNDVTITAAVQAAGPTDWPTDTSTVTNQTASEAFGFTGALAGVDAAILSNWAKGNGNVAFANAGTILLDAFLLNCANNQTAIDEAALNFKITSISVVDGVVTVATPEVYNGTVEIQGAATLEGPWHDKTTGDHFFKAVLTVGLLPE